MSSHAAIIDALTAFYRQVIRHPYLDDAALKVPPSSGWETIDSTALRDLGKSETVIELLRHLPYLEADGPYDRLLIEYETVPIAYTQHSNRSMEEVNPLPACCVYITEGVDREGYSLILDVENGAMTAYSISGYDILPEFRERYNGLPRSEQWRAHRTLPAADLLDIWAAKYSRLVNMLVPNIIGGPTTGTFRTRASNTLQSELLAQRTDPLEEWSPDMQKIVQMIKDDQMRQREMARWQHVANVYNCFLRHGWPDSFDKRACRAEVVELENQARAEEIAFLDANNPDAALFDD